MVLKAVFHRKLSGVRALLLDYPAGSPSSVLSS
jgi:hypothetical protein